MTPDEEWDEWSYLNRRLWSGVIVLCALMLHGIATGRFPSLP